MVRLQAEPFDPGAMLSQFCAGRTDVGAVVSFTGLVRADQGEATALELEAYPGFTEAEIEAMAEAAKVRWSLADYLRRPPRWEVSRQARRWSSWPAPPPTAARLSTPPTI